MKKVKIKIFIIIVTTAVVLLMYGTAIPSTQSHASEYNFSESSDSLGSSEIIGELVKYLFELDNISDISHCFLDINLTINEINLFEIVGSVDISFPIIEGFEGDYIYAFIGYNSVQPEEFSAIALVSADDYGNVTITLNEIFEMYIMAAIPVCSVCREIECECPEPWLEIKVVNDDGSYTIEILNNTEEAISTKGLHLIDGDGLYKWRIPGFIIQPGEPIRICGVGNNIIPILKRAQVSFDVSLEQEFQLV